ncbi:PDZ domain-containing protein [Leptospira ilyithenensis]|uniref:Serine protease n=1 Tax=Leptospira ilyithenensis TaxID=2484901 RepID=A0A4V6QMU8_9LEPT|nr:serine protease [Leptospira ilyithenensis]TGN14689.1 serine protease [Leptospira ilyithenensis]
MKIILTSVLFYFSLFSVEIFSKSVPVGKDDNFIVQVKSTVQYPNFIQPWRFKNPETRHSYGVVVGENLILTTAQTVYYQTNTEVQKFGSLKNYTAKLIKIDHDLGLALLKVEEKEFGTGLTPIQFGSEIFLASAGVVLEYKEFRNLSEKKIRTIKLDVDTYANGYIELPYVEVQSDDKLEGIGELIVDEVSKIPQGVLIYFKDSQNTGKMVPNFTINQFLNCNVTKKCFSYKGFRFRPLTDAPSRNFYGVKKENSGVLIAEIYPESSASSLLKLEDVLLEVGSHKIDPKGYFEHPKYGKILLSYLFHSGEDLGFGKDKKIPLKILRNSKIMNVDFEMEAFPEPAVRIPFGNTRYRKPEYLMLGGIVFLELSEHYLMEFGNQWRTRVSKQLLYLNDYHRINNTGETKKVILLSQVLPLPGNQAYHSLQQVILKKVNGKEPKDIKELFQIATEGEDPFLVIELDDGTQVVFEKEEIANLNKEAIKVFHIPKPHNLSE